ncbi:PTS mannose transporter subunit IIA [Lentibacillus kapialis]|uniref:PTS mannose transporter subunit IIA n=1 Tax=Lentibacillus kapialis TaxID=340214 RepID=A0A917UXT7_9BACI|nr:PTS lactose/cellobiose transporter subunit IIA [Lentibacillus kapialis]GGJ94100.1 PTS mannose transporter subunit IIA [Lentibacillus kapialis]
MDMEQVIMGIIMNSGDAKSDAMEAIQHAKKKEVDRANQLIESAENELKEAHSKQTEMIQDEARGEKTELSLLLVHAQDHLMTATTFKDLAKEFVDLYEQI